MKQPKHMMEKYKISSKSETVAPQKSAAVFCVFCKNKGMIDVK